MYQEKCSSFFTFFWTDAEKNMRHSAFLSRFWQYMNDSIEKEFIIMNNSRNMSICFYGTRHIFWSLVSNIAVWQIETLAFQVKQL